MKKFIIIIILPLIASCNLGKKVKGDDFTIDVKLSQAASSRLGKLNETVKVIAYFDGDGKKIEGQETAPFRDVYLGQKEIEIREGEQAHFENIRFSQADYSRLFSPKYYVTLNIVSGRRAYKDNLLACDVPIYTIDKFANRVTTVNCKLIGEK
jgi:hypothetical protein